MHNRPHISILFTRLLLIGIILGGCDETGLGGSESVSLLKGEPVILDSASQLTVPMIARMELLTLFLTRAIGFTCGSFG